MDWMQVLTMIGSILAAYWLMHRENVQMHTKFQEETKNFHGRLCILEERYVQMMQRILEKK